MEYGGFRLASSPKSCSIKAWTNCVNVVGDGAGSGFHQNTSEYMY
jgi:hypothetical protein